MAASDLETLAQDWLTKRGHWEVGDLPNLIALLRSRDERAGRELQKAETEVERLKAERGEFSDVLHRATQAEAKIEAALAQCKEIQRAEDMGERITAGYAIGRIREALKGGRE